jgi:hypothetical protein
MTAAYPVTYARNLQHAEELHADIGEFWQSSGHKRGYLRRWLMLRIADERERRNARRAELKAAVMAARKRRET